MFVLAEALPEGVEDAQQAWNRGQPAVPRSGVDRAWT